MGLFSKREYAVEVPLPDLDRIALPDVKYIHKHLGDVRALIDVLPYRSEKPELRASGARLASQLMVGFPDLMAGTPDEGLVPSMVEEAVAASATNGFALASLYGQSTPTSKSMYEAMVWAGYLTLAEAMRPLAAAHVFALDAGHFIGHHGEEATGPILALMDWDAALRGSKPVVPMAEMFSKAWASMCGAR